MLMQPQPDYNFIFNTDSKKKRAGFPGGGSQRNRVLIVVLGAIGLITIVLIIMTLLNSAGSANKDALLRAAQQQAEIIRISDMAAERAKGTSAKNLALTTNLSLQSDQKTLITTLKSQGVKVDAKQLALGKDPKTDVALTNAEQANRFDEVYVETVKQLLTEYQRTLKSAYESTDSKKLRDILSAQYENAGLLATAQQ